MSSKTQKENGYTLVELLITLVLSVIIIVPFYQALSESITVKTNTRAMNDLQQQSRFAFSKLDYLLSKDFKSIESISTTEIRGESRDETALAGNAYRAVSIKVCGSNLIYSVSGTCGTPGDNQILASNVSNFSVKDLKATQGIYASKFYGFNLKLRESNGPNSIDATAKFILGGI